MHIVWHADCCTRVELKLEPAEACIGQFAGAVSSRASETVNSRMAGGASMLAVLVGVAILLSGWGVPLPFGLTIG